MSTYYPAPRRHATPVDRSSYDRLPSVDLAESSIYIFPSPSSTPPSPSPSHSSRFSEHSDISVSVFSFSDFGSPGYSPLLTQIERPSRVPLRQPFLCSPDSTQYPRTVVQGASYELTKSPHQGPVPVDPDIVPFDDTSERALNDEPLSCTLNLEIPGTTFRHPLIRRKHGQSSFPCEQEKILPITPQHRSLLHESTTPLISFFSSLLGVDNSTLDLLTLPTSSASIFFPTGESSSTDLSSWDEADDPIAPHGMEKLFAVATEKSFHIRQRMLCFDESPLGECCLVPLPTIWFMVTELVSNGHKFLYQFIHSTARAN